MEVKYTAEELKKKIKECIELINAKTELYGVIGNPIRHSLSPIIHNGVFQRMGLNAVYLAFEVNDLENAMSGIRELGLRGVSVTHPLKTRILPLLDEVEELAGRIRAVNTIMNEGGRLKGYNTDGSGALEALGEKVGLKEKKVLLLGAGGTARAIGFRLKEKGVQTIISNRSLDKAEALAKELGFICRPLSSIDDLSFDVVINATSLGMFPHETESPIPKKLLREGMVVMDIVYEPLKTELLKEADERHCVTIDGLEMLAHQGAGQLEIWTGKRPDIGKINEDLRRAVHGKKLSQIPPHLPLQKGGEPPTF
jgi:shikimate dehydrogenase